MGLFDQAIATCKQYLKPVKQATRELISLQEKAKQTAEFDQINEDVALDGLVETNKAPFGGPSKTKQDKKQ